MNKKTSIVLLLVLLLSLFPANTYAANDKVLVQSLRKAKLSQTLEIAFCQIRYFIAF